jgi:hypothetical protein
MKVSNKPATTHAGGSWRQILITVIVALLVGSSAPWWWDPVTKLLSQDAPQVTPSDSGIRLTPKQSVKGTKALTKEEVFSIVEEQFHKTSNDRGEVQVDWLADLGYHPRDLPFRQGLWALLQQSYGVGNAAMGGEGTAGYAREVIQAMSTITCILSQPNNDKACSKKSLEYQLQMLTFNARDDFPKVKAFLDEFSAFAQGLPEKKLNLTHKNLAEEHKAFEEQKRRDDRLLEQRKGNGGPAKHATMSVSAFISRPVNSVV